MRTPLSVFIALLLLGCDGDVPAARQTNFESAWTSLASSEGCLVGCQNAINGLGEGTCLREKPWRDFLAIRADDKVEYLCSRMASTEPTKVHVCPFGNATEGELSVYTLQHLTDRLWIDYDGPNQEILTEIAGHKAVIDGGGLVSEQDTLNRILSSEAQREALTAFFTKPNQPNKEEQAIAP